MSLNESVAAFIHAYFYKGPLHEVILDMLYEWYYSSL